MKILVSRRIEEILSKPDVPGRIEIESWGLGVAFLDSLYVLNLFDVDGNNHPEIVSDRAVGGIVQLLALAQESDVKVFYWPHPDGDSVLFVGRLKT